MTVTVHLPKDVEHLFLAQAQARGLSVDVYVQLLVEQPAMPTTQQQHPAALSAEEFDRGLDEIADEIAAAVPAAAGPLSDYAMSRESIYTREDEWNR